MKNEMNTKIYDRACESIAGGLLTNFKSAKGAQSIYIESASGARLKDYDGNTYYDFALTFGPAILGHSNTRYQQALMNQIQKLYTCEFSIVQIEAAEKIKSCVKGLDVMRFTPSGNEADAQAIRVARGYTKKNYVVKFTSHFHGGPDCIVGGVVHDPTFPVVSAGEYDNDYWSHACNTQGRARHSLDDTMMIEFNNLPQIQELFEAHGNDIACVIMEPVPLNLNGIIASKEYMRGVRELCSKHNVIMIYDEILTGFRIGLGGAAEFYGVRPDLWVFSKAIGGGFPVAVYGGKREIMDVITNCEVLAPGTFNGHPLACAAILNVLEQLSENDCAAYKHMNRLGEKLKQGLLEKAKKNGVDMIIQGFPAALCPVFTKRNRINTQSEAMQYANIRAYYVFGALMKKYGVLNNGRFCVGLAHTDEDVAYAVEVSDKAFRELRELL